MSDHSRFSTCCLRDFCHCASVETHSIAIVTFGGVVPKDTCFCHRSAFVYVKLFWKHAWKSCDGGQLPGLPGPPLVPDLNVG
jgi:hypothetical protein